MCKVVKMILRFLYRGEKYLAMGADIVNVCVRAYVMRIFILSGWLKSASISGTFFLFKDVYKVSWINYKFLALVSMFSELILAPLLLLGFMTRYLAIYFFIMTLVINSIYQVNENYYWMLIFAILTTYGGGKFSIDHQIRCRVN